MLGGCDTDQRLELTAKNLNEVAEACLLDVRDRGMKYEQSPNCNVLEPSPCAMWRQAVFVVTPQHAMN
jgi:hypothetical protein